MRQSVRQPRLFSFLWYHQRQREDFSEEIALFYCPFPAGSGIAGSGWFAEDFSLADGAAEIRNTAVVGIIETIGDPEQRGKEKNALLSSCGRSR